MVDAIDTPHKVNGRQEQEARRHAAEPAYEAEDRRGFDAGLACGDHLTGVAREPLCVPLDAAVRKPLVNTIGQHLATRRNLFRDQRWCFGWFSHGCCWALQRGRRELLPFFCNVVNDAEYLVWFREPRVGSRVQWNADSGGF